jgi:serine/threonine protein kinase
LNYVVKLHLLEKSIGEGTFGKVKLGTHHITGEKVILIIIYSMIIIGSDKNLGKR